MKIVTSKLTEAARKALKKAELCEEGIKLGPPGSLPAQTYKELMKVLETAGFKWNRSAKMHVKAGADVGEEVRIILGEGQVVDEQKTYAFFPTAPKVADIMARELWEFLPRYIMGETIRILEPSAGDGALLRAVIKHVSAKAKPNGWFTPGNRARLEMTAIELDPKKYGKLCGVAITHTADFLQFRNDTLYHGVIMNPPFTNGADVKHVQHAWGMVKAGGVLVALVSRGWRQNKTKVHQWLADTVAAHGDYRELKAGEADDGMTRNANDLITIRKPLTATQQAREQDLTGTLTRRAAPRRKEPTTPEMRSEQTGNRRESKRPIVAAREALAGMDQALGKLKTSLAKLKTKIQEDRK